ATTSYWTTEPSPCTVSPAAASASDGPPNRSRHKLWPMMPASSLLSASAPYSGCFARSYVDGSIDGHGGVHSGFTPLRLSAISAMWPPSTKTVTRRSEVSMLCARRFRYALSGIFEYYAPPVSTLGAPGRAAVLGIESA